MCGGTFLGRNRCLPGLRQTLADAGSQWLNPTFLPMMKNGDAAEAIRRGRILRQTTGGRLNCGTTLMANNICRREDVHDHQTTVTRMRAMRRNIMETASPAILPPKERKEPKEKKLCLPRLYALFAFFCGYHRARILFPVYAKYRLKRTGIASVWPPRILRASKGSDWRTSRNQLKRILERQDRRSFPGATVWVFIPVGIAAAGRTRSSRKPRHGRNAQGHLGRGQLNEVEPAESCGPALGWIPHLLSLFGSSFPLPSPFFPSTCPSTFSFNPSLFVSPSLYSHRLNSTSLLPSRTRPWGEAFHRSSSSRQSLFSSVNFLFCSLTARNRVASRVTGPRATGASESGLQEIIRERERSQFPFWTQFKIMLVVIKSRCGIVVLIPTGSRAQSDAEERDFGIGRSGLFKRFDCAG